MGHAENLLLPHPPAAKRQRKETGGHGAGKFKRSRVIMGALHYGTPETESWWNDVKSPVEGLNITDRYKV